MDKKQELAIYIESEMERYGKIFGMAVRPDFVDRVAGKCIDILSGDNPQTIDDHVAKIRELAKEKHNCKVDVIINYHE